MEASGALIGGAIAGKQLEPEEHLLPVREVADDASERRRQLFDERRCRKNSLIFSDLRMLEDVDDLEIILRAQFRFANPPKIRYRQLGAWRRTRYIELQNVFRQGESLRLNKA